MKDEEGIKGTSDKEKTELRLEGVSASRGIMSKRGNQGKGR